MSVGKCMPADGTTTAMLAHGSLGALVYRAALT